MLYKVVLTFESVTVMKQYPEEKVTEQYFQACGALNFAVQRIVLA